MALQYNSKAIVFFEKEAGDSDKIFSVFSKNFGKIDLFAKAIRKIASKLKGGIELYSISDIEFVQGKNRKTLTDAFFVKRFKSLSEPKKIKIALEISSLLDKLVKGQEKDERLWNLIAETFERLDSWPPGNANCSVLYYFFIWNFFYISGHGPEIEKCAGCSGKLNPYNLYFSNKDGGVVCKNCFLKEKRGEKVNSDIIKILRIILKKDWGIFSKLRIRKSSAQLFADITKKYYLHILSDYS